MSSPDGTLAAAEQALPTTDAAQAAAPLQTERPLGRSLHERYPLPESTACTCSEQSLATPESRQQDESRQQNGATCTSSTSGPEPDLKGWRKPAAGLSLPEVHSSVKVGQRWHQKARIGRGWLPVLLCYHVACN